MAKSLCLSHIRSKGEGPQFGAIKIGSFGNLMSPPNMHIEWGLAVLESTSVGSSWKELAVLVSQTLSSVSDSGEIRSSVMQVGDRPNNVHSIDVRADRVHWKFRALSSVLFLFLSQICSISLITALFIISIDGYGRDTAGLVFGWKSSRSEVDAVLAELLISESICQSNLPFGMAGFDIGLMFRKTASLAVTDLSKFCFLTHVQELEREQKILFFLSKEQCRTISFSSATSDETSLGGKEFVNLIWQQCLARVDEHWTCSR
ncbi:hypothetical protein Tco_0523464 [Tanacetum coccineum]